MTRQVAVVVDTNVVVAGLLTADPASPVARIVDRMLAAEFPFVLSEALLTEYRAVLLRPHIRKLHGLSESEIDSILTELAQHAIVFNPTPGSGPSAPDAGDQLIWDLLAAKPGLRLVTGDKVLLKDSGMAGRVMTPAEFTAAQ